MRKIILGIILGFIIIFSVKSVYAEQNKWKLSLFDKNDTVVVKIIDGDISCYVSQSIYSGVGGTGGISCVKR